MNNPITNYLKRHLSKTELIMFGLLLMAALPIVTVWTINALANAGGADFHLAHTPQNYGLALLLLGLIRAGRV